MGKRKLHSHTYFQCDWTGLPMRHTNCYMPDWNESGKLLKHGSYACWEAVVAHAQEQLLTLATDPTSYDGDYDDEGQMTECLRTKADKMKRIQEHVNDLVGCNVVAAPHWSKLAWFGRGDEVTISSPKEFFDACCKITSPIVAVRIPAVDAVHEVLCDEHDMTGKFEGHLTRPFNDTSPSPNSFQTVRKKGSKDRDLTVFYWPFKNGLPFNQTASNAFKMQIYGDALVVQQTKEPCFLPRERFVNYDLLTFNEQFGQKRKGKETATLSTDEYALAKAQMSSELQSLEALASSSASLPADLAKAAVLPPPTGAELAALLRARGQAPPLKKARILPEVESPRLAVEASA